MNPPPPVLVSQGSVIFDTSPIGRRLPEFERWGTLRGEIL